MGSEKRARPVPAEEETDGGGSGPPAKRARVSSSLHRANEPSRVSEVKLWVNKGSVQVPRSPTALQSIEPARQQVYQRPGVPPPTDLGSFVVPDRVSPPSRPDDSEGHYVYQLGENISSRFKILAKLGEGTFGRVLECWDRKTHNRVAVKIVRNVQKYRDAAMIELEVLNTLERNDPSGSHHCVALVEWFDYRGHVCMVFEKLGASLYDFLRRNHYEAFELPLVRAFLRQLLEATLYLHDLHIIHTDLKPENILVEACDPEPENNEPRMVPRLPSSTDIKVIDLGSATFDEQYHSTVVSTRHYRAPEVILGLGWSFPADMWSIGCIIAELATGDALFQTHENLEHLAMMEQILGRIPKHLVKAANRAAQKMFHHRTSELLWPGSASKRSIRTVDKLVPVKRLLATSSRPSVRPHAEQLGDLIEQLLTYDPAQRMTARQALRHPFFHEAEPGD